MASGQEKDMAREEGSTAPNEVVNNAAEIDLNQDEAMADIELDDIEDLNLDLGDEHNHGEAENHDEVEHHGEAENHGGTNNLGEEDNTGGKEATGDENDFTEGEGTTYPISEEIVQLQAKVATQNITILQQQTSIDGLKKHTQNLEARLSITMKEEYAVEFEAAARLLQKPLAEEEMMHIFMKGLPVNLQQAHMTGGMTNWSTYKEMKEQVIKTDNIIRTYIFGPEKTSLQPRAEGSGGHGNRPQNAKGGSGWNKRPFQQRDHQPGPQAKRPNGGGGHGPNKPDFSDKQCRGCGRMGHGVVAKDVFTVSYHGGPLDDEMTMLTLNALNYTLSRPDIEAEESY
ncbi:unnamed protein product [Closterium sp. NIES-65]|nr:unnamed protein product [Closterium sp. NIES-65]